MKLSTKQIEVLAKVTEAGPVGYVGKCREGRTLDVLKTHGLIVCRAVNPDGSGSWAYFLA